MMVIIRPHGSLKSSDQFPDSSRLELSLAAAAAAARVGTSFCRCRPRVLLRVVVAAQRQLPPLRAALCYARLRGCCCTTA